MATERDEEDPELNDDNSIVVVEDGPLKGAKLSSGAESKLTTRSCPTVDRWQSELGSHFVNEQVDRSLKRLKLDKFRYISTFHKDAFTNVSNLTYLSLTRCSHLEQLPESIGLLKNLKTVCTWILLFEATRIITMY